jgi:hypothetical protein
VNVRRGLFRVWVLITALWFCAAGGLWIAIWGEQLGDAGTEVFHHIVHRTPDYEAICAALRSARAAGITPAPIPAIPALELDVENEVGRVVAAPGRCLAEFAAEENIGLIPVALRVVKSDGTRLRRIQANNGSLRDVGDFTKVPVREDTLALHGASMFSGLASILVVPIFILLIGCSIGWAVNGFRSPEKSAPREPRL